MKISFLLITLFLAAHLTQAKPLPRSTPKAENFDPLAIEAYLSAVKEAKQEIHSFMILRHGKVVAEQWMGDNAADKVHVMHSVSKTWTSTAIGFAVAEGKLKVTDKVISFFPQDLPDEVSPNLKELEIRHLLTMSGGHATDPTQTIRSQQGSWERAFLATPLEFKPGPKYGHLYVVGYPSESDG
jgi:CubicO group peptidase (beta-lactamase class C family)